MFDVFFLCVMQVSGADALELNLSCPHGMGERGMGLACGQVGLLMAISFMSLQQCTDVFIDSPTFRAKAHGADC